MLPWARGCSLDGGGVGRGEGCADGGVVRDRGRPLGGRSGFIIWAGC